MWVYHPPLTVGIPALLVSARRHIPFVYEIQDMWPETLAATGMVSSARALKLVSHLANFVYRHAAAINVISRGFQQNLIDKGVPPAKIKVIPNWADEDIYFPVLRHEEFAARYGLAGHFNVVFGGNHGAAQALTSVLQAAQLVADLRDLQFVLIGDGIEKAALVRHAQEAGLHNVLFLERQPATVMRKFYASADVLLVHLKDDPLFEITIPSKMMAYLACGRPILAATKGDAAELVNSAHAGFVCEPQNPHALAGALRKLYMMSRAEREALGAAGRQAYLAGYTRAVLVAQYETLFENLVPAHARQM
jgi:glycosyltransferase involved in cell wall biosynthesis